MFTTGEFSKIARVSRRLLRHYREIGLFTPIHLDHDSGYHYYSIHQLPDLNRILALRDLGFSLEQIQRTIEDNVSNSELRGMFQMRKAEIERTLRDELEKMRAIESRLQSLEHQQDKLDVIIKSIPAQHYLSAHYMCVSIDHATHLLDQVYKGLPLRVGKNNVSEMLTMLHSEDFHIEGANIEIGFLVLKGKSTQTITLEQSDLTFTTRILEAVETMATVVITEHSDFWHLGTTAIGQWMETQGYVMAGPQREIWHTFPSDLSEKPIVELQTPVQKRLSHHPTLLG